MSIRDSVPTPDQDAVAEGDTAATSAEVGMPPVFDSVGEGPDDAGLAAEEGIDPDTGMPNTAGGVGGAGAGAEAGAGGDAR
jgi:hypothetical protein